MAEITAFGNLGDDPILKYDKNGGAYLRFSIADEKSRKNQQTGEWNSLAKQWLQCSIWGPLAEYYAEHLFSGDRVRVWGEFYARQYDGQSGPGTSLDVKVHGVQIVKQKQGSEARAAGEAAYHTQQQQSQSAMGWGAGAGADEPPF